MTTPERAPRELRRPDVGRDAANSCERMQIRLKSSGVKTKHWVTDHYEVTARVTSNVIAMMSELRIFHIGAMSRLWLDRDLNFFPAPGKGRDIAPTHARRLPRPSAALYRGLSASVGRS